MIKKIMLSLITFIILVTIVFYAFDLIINTTKSMPIGIYQNTKNQIITKDDIVTFTYHNTNFLKRVIASAGDHIEIIDNIKVNGQILPNSQVFKFDRNNNTLPIVNLKKF
ncbi:hypothetical protein CFT13S00388_09555, partial [Campylobacter fetus subsp. testudinum]|uniref:S26 family signal peptidase n=1 Tax=Campylobacter fetus TaxID=196 RepID=UPI000828B971